MTEAEKTKAEALLSSIGSYRGGNLSLSVEDVELIEKAVRQSIDAPSSGDMGDLRDILSEEAAEIIVERVKWLRFPPGSDSYEKWIAKGNLPPRDRWVQEVGDLFYIVLLLVEKGVISIDELRVALERKREKMTKLYGEQASLKEPLP